MHTPRIRCNYCSRRILASSAVCPHCHHNPRAFYWKSSHLLLLLIPAVLLLAAAGWFLREDLNMLGVAPGTSPTPIAPALTSTPIRIVVVASPVPTTPTRVPPTATRTAIPPTRTVSPTFTATRIVTPTRVARTPGVTETPTRVPTPVPIPAPVLFSPADGERILGAGKRVQLAFQPAQPLSPLEWYRLQVDYLDRAGQPVSWCGWTRESFIEFPRELFDEASPTVRSFLWRVVVVRSSQAAPSTCDAPYDPLSAPSQVWTFYWY